MPRARMVANSNQSGAHCVPARPIGHGHDRAVYVGFHIINHLFGLIGPDAHAFVMDLGRKVFRAPLLEPLLGKR